MNSPHQPPHGHPRPPSDVHESLLAAPYAAVRPYLRIVLTGDPSGLGGDKLAYSINPRLTALLCYRTSPDTYEAAVLDVRHSRAWGAGKQELWFAALGNLAHERFEHQTFHTDTDTGVHVVHGIDWPGSAHVMRLVDVAQQPMPYGAVVMLPSPNTMLYAVLHSKRSVAMIPFLYQTFASLARDGEAVTDQIIWWRNGRITGMTTQPDPGGGVGIQQTPEFSALLDRELPD